MNVILLYPPSNNKNSEHASKPILKPLYTYSSGSIFPVNFGALKKQFPGLKLEFTSPELESNS